jgi:diguanylate cyclase (GGDEF)-like protein
MDFYILKNQIRVFFEMNANHIVDQLVDLTSIRDIEFLQFSLLQTLHENMNPLDLRIYKIDADGKLRSEIVYDEMKGSVIDERTELPDKVKELIFHINQADLSEHTQKYDSAYLTIYRINKTHTATLYLQVLNKDKMPCEHKQLLISLLDIFRNYIGLLSENITDSLTGLLNRKSFDGMFDKINNIISDDNDIYSGDRRNKEKSKYWLAMIDIDHFKMINDKYGHLYGDDVLILLAERIEKNFRFDDLIFRFGGEEFVLIIKSVDIEGARCALQKLLKSISSFLFPQVGRVTISIGAVCMTQNSFSTTLLDYADQALYYSKNNGRNQLTFFEDMVEEGLTKELEIKCAEIAFF